MHACRLAQIVVPQGLQLAWQIQAGLGKNSCMNTFTLIIAPRMCFRQLLLKFCACMAVVSIDKPGQVLQGSAICANAFHTSAYLFAFVIGVHAHLCGENGRL